MKKYFKYVFIIMLIFITSFITYISVSITFAQKDPGQNLTDSKMNRGEKLCCSEIAGLNKFSENSLYNMDGDWKNENNNTLKLSSLRGEKVVLSMFFSNCTYACPLIVNDMRKIEASLFENKQRNIKFLLVSIDPERDKPEVLRSFKRRLRLNNNWELLSGTEKNIRELAALLDFKYVKEIDGSFSHSNLISVLNKQGEIIYQQTGLNSNVQPVIEKIKEVE